jgi:imidazolonepropionase-like amidohydrolase
MIRVSCLSLLLAACLSFGTAQAVPAAAAAAAAPAAPSTFAITDVRIFDGERVLPRGTVVVADGKIKAVGAGVRLPDGAEVIDGAGAMLLPGLIDSHTHTFGNSLERALVFGVTTELDMFTSPDLARQMRKEQARTGAPGRADLRSAGILATAPGGHGTQFGVPVPTLTRPEEAQAFVDARIAEGSDYIKIVSEDGAAFGRPMPALDRATIASLIRAAHARKKLAVVHVSTQERARQALEDGADGLVHLFGDSAPEPAFIRAATAHKSFVIATLTVVESTTGVPSGSALADDLRLKAYLRPEEISSLRSAFPAGRTKLENAFAAVRQLKSAGVPILAGSDAPNPGTAHGASIHREMELLVKAGLSPTEALAAATSVPARAFGLADRGRIAPGLKADLVLVAGDPIADITATRNIVRIWKSGRPFERPLAEVPKAGPAPALPAGGSISDFEEGKLAAAFGSGWVESTDAMAGGKSTVQAKLVEGGAESAHSLEISGTIRPGFSYPWAGMLFFPGDKPMAPADLSAARELTFWAKGSGGTFQLMLFAASRGRAPAQQSFTAGPEWKRFSFPLSIFGLDGKDLTGIFFGGGPAEGEFRLQIDGVRLVAGQQ